MKIRHLGLCKQSKGWRTRRDRKICELVKASEIKQKIDMGPRVGFPTGSEIVDFLSKRGLYIGCTHKTSPEYFLDSWTCCHIYVRDMWVVELTYRRRRK